MISSGLYHVFRRYQISPSKVNFEEVVPFDSRSDILDGLEAAVSFDSSSRSDTLDDLEVDRGGERKKKKKKDERYQMLLSVDDQDMIRNDRE